MSEHWATPLKCINNVHDLEAFQKSVAHQEIQKFVQACAQAVMGVSNTSEDVVVSPVIARIVAFMDELIVLVDEIPPIKQPMRFGNKAYRTWHTRMAEKVPGFLAEILPTESAGASIELAPYILDMFGNATRIDYGTGHELNFALFAICLHKLALVGEHDLAALVTKGFVAYIKTMRKLQLTYLLEPAGSHGVWGLDDYHCLVFFWGAAQLSKHTEIRPSSIHDADVLREYADEYMYLEGIRFIKQIKHGAPFAETSSMLNDISAMPDWARICSGLMRLFLGEVLNKLPVVQHVVFGSLLQCTWKNPQVPAAAQPGSATPEASIPFEATMPIAAASTHSEHHHLHTVQHPQCHHHVDAHHHQPAASTSSTVPTLPPSATSSSETAP